MKCVSLCSWQQGIAVLQLLSYFYERYKSWLLVLQWEKKPPTPGPLPTPGAMLLQVPGIKSCCQLVCCGSLLAMSTVLEPACSTAMQSSGVL